MWSPTSPSSSKTGAVLRMSPRACHVSRESSHAASTGPSATRNWSSPHSLCAKVDWVNDGSIGVSDESPQPYIKPATASETTLKRIRSLFICCPPWMKRNVMLRAHIAALWAGGNEGDCRGAERGDGMPQTLTQV